MSFPCQPTLSTERLTLRDIEYSDWKEIMYLRSDPTINQYVHRPKSDSKEKAVSFIEAIKQKVDNGESFYWCISEKNNPAMIGSICLWNFEKEAKSAEVGYDLDLKFHKKGIMNEALGAVLNFGFNTVKLEKIEAFTQSNNQASIALLLRNGFQINASRNDKDNELNSIFEIYSPSAKNI